ncbi:DNA-binding response regulator [Vibrio sinensis]|uniref:DNA-binding response regulator n=1 Tax=Vibrio sinensis TaxID=2302434 RepID=A0A3A6QZ05_9VIBR|nr:response regulator transcription factor [Vibrio sinensis]RJX75746.1 DNA-binding response regulator [Vibrio sinensis]
MPLKNLVILGEKNLQASLIEQQLEQNVEANIIIEPHHQLSDVCGESVIDLVLIDFDYLEQLFSQDALPNFDLLGVNLLVHNVPTEKLDHAFIYWRSIKGLLLNSAPIKHLCESVLYILKGGLWLPRICLEKLVMLKRDPSLQRCAMYDSLTSRERQVLDQLTNGHSNKQIANQLFLSESTVKSHIYKIYRKLDIHKRREAVNIAKVVNNHPPISGRDLS